MLTLRQRGKERKESEGRSKKVTHPQSLSRTLEITGPPASSSLPSHPVSSSLLQYTSKTTSPLLNLRLSPTNQAHPLIKNSHTHPTQSYIQAQPIPSRPKVERLTRAVMH